MIPVGSRRRRPLTRGSRWRRCRGSRRSARSPAVKQRERVPETVVGARAEPAALHVDPVANGRLMRQHAALRAGGRARGVHQQREVADAAALLQRADLRKLDRSGGADELLAYEEAVVSFLAPTPRGEARERPARSGRARAAPPRPGTPPRPSRRTTGTPVDRTRPTECGYRRGRTHGPAHAPWTARPPGPQPRRAFTPSRPIT
jgi:hypothetical protein